MLKLFTWPTPNGQKVSIMLEKLGIPYEATFVDIRKGQQFANDFRQIFPNSKIPAIIDEDGFGGPISVFEGGAILCYLAKKYSSFLPATGPAHWKALEWLYWQVGGLGPTLGQAGFFAKFSKVEVPIAINRFVTEADRLFDVMEHRLTETPYLGGGEYTFADIACYPWVASASTVMSDVLGELIVEKAALTRWLKAVGDRPGVQRGMAIVPPEPDETTI